MTESSIHDPAGGTTVWKHDARFDFPIQLTFPEAERPTHPVTGQPLSVGDGALPFFWPFFQAFDINGDGTADLLGDHHGFVSQSRHSDLLRSIENGQGGKVELEYASTILQSDPDLETLALGTVPLETTEENDVERWSARPVVSRTTVTGPNLGAEAVTEYVYAHPRFSQSLRSDLGFRLSQRTRPDQSLVREFFRQRRGLTGRMAKLEVREGADLVFERLEGWEVLAGTMPGSHPTVDVGRLRSVRAAIQYPGGGEGALREQTLSYDDFHGYGFIDVVVDERPTGTLCTKLAPASINEDKWLVRRVEERTQHAQWNGNPSSAACSGTLLSQSTFTYDNHQVATRADTVQRRDGTGTLSEVTTRFGYDGFGNLTFRTAADGVAEKERTTEFCYDGDAGCTNLEGQSSHSVLVGIRDPLGKLTTFIPDAATGMVVGIVSEYSDEPAITRDLDPFGRIEREFATPTTEGSAFLRTEFVYHDDVVPAYQERREYVDQAGAGGGNYVSSVTVSDGLGGTWKTIAETPSGWVGTMIYRDPVSRTVRETYPSACADATCSTLSGENGTARVVTSDALGRPIQIATPDGLSVLEYAAAPPFDQVFEKNAKGDLSLRLLDGERMREVHECANSVAPEVSSLAGESCTTPDVTEYAYEATGELAVVTDPGENSLVYHYDTLGRAWRIEDPDGGTSTTVYDALGNVESTTNARDQIVTFEYDDLDRLTRINQPTGPHRNYELIYLPHGRQLERERVLDQNENPLYLLTFEYDDPMGRLSRRSYTYPNEATYGFPGPTLLLDFAYDELGRVTSVQYPDTETVVRYEYTGAYLTEVCEVTSPSGSCADETAVPYVSGVTYDDLGRRSTVQTPAGMRTYSYLEETHRLAKDQFTSSTSGLYDRTLRYAPETDPGSGFYDPLGNVLEIEAQTTGSAVDFSASYAYDQRNRLKAWQAGDMAAAEHFKYDELGNLTGHAVGESDPANQIFGGARPHAITQNTDQGISYAYDADGNLLSETWWSGGERHYRFDALNRLTCVGPATTNCSVLEVDYDSSGSRLHEIRRLMSGALYPRRYAGEYFALDGDRADFHILACGEQIAYKRKLPVTLRTAPAWSLPGLGLEPPPLLALALVSALGLAGIGLLAVRRDWAPGLREDPALAALTLALVVVLVVPPIPARAGGGGQTIDYRRWILSDPIGSATVVLEANPEDPGNQEGRAEREVVYKPFGAIHDSAGSQGLDTEQFAGHPREAATGLHYMGARWQDSNTGTFVSVDPLVPDAGDPQSYNAYSYARNNPLSLVDPTGSLPEGPWPVLNLHWYFIGFDPGFQEWGTTGQWISFDAYGGLSWYSYLNGTLIDAVASQFVAGEAHVVQAQIGSLSAGTIPSSQSGSSDFQLASGNVEGVPVDQLTGKEWTAIGKAAAGMLGEIKDLTTTEFAEKFGAERMLKWQGGDLELGINQQVMIRDLNTIINSSIRHSIALNLEAVRQQAIESILLAPAMHAGGLARAAALGYKAASFSHSGSFGFATATCGIGAGCGVTYQRAH
jgi:RHS repeat-associated protein